MTRSRGGRVKAALAPFWGLGAALAASGLLLGIPAGSRTAAAQAPLPTAIAWPRAEHGVTLANLPDGTAYQPALFLNARTSIGTALSPDGTSFRLLLVSADRSVRQLRSTPFAEGPSFQAFTTTGDALIWAEGARGKIQIWRAGLRDRKPARQLTADVGTARFYGSQHDLTVNDGTLHWAASRPNVTEVRSIALTGGPVHTRTVPGEWTLSDWPWLVNGSTATRGTTLLKNLITNQDTPVARLGTRSVTQCNSTWCRVATLTDDGSTRLDLMHPDGSARHHVAGDTARTVTTDVAPLDRYEVYSKVGPNSNLNGNARLLVYDLATRRSVEVSPDAGKVAYRDGVLSWSTGNQNAFIWHAVDLRTI